MSSCDPEFPYTLQGSIKGQSKNPIQVNYKFKSIDENNNWKRNVSDSMTITDEMGEFQIQVSTMAYNFTGIEIIIDEPEYEPVKIESFSNNWTVKSGVNLRESNHTLPTINLTLLDKVKACKKGTLKAITEAQKGEFTFYEYLKTGTRNQSLINKFQFELQKLGINYKIISITDIPANTNLEFETECYMDKMKEIIEEKYGIDWLKTLKNTIKH